MAVLENLGEELSKLRIEIRVVKAALRDGKAHLNMPAKDLTEYFLSLNDKENLLLSRMLQSSPDVPTVGKTVGTGAAVVRPAAALPDPIPAMDRNSLESVVEHMHICEASAQESGKALRALASIAYSATAQVNANARVLTQVLRLADLHGSSEPVKLGAVQTICNMADDSTTALEKLTERSVLVVLVSALVQSAEASKNTVAKASEAIARIIAAAKDKEIETGAEVAAGGGVMPLTKLFAAAITTGNTVSAEPISQICDRLVANEVVDHVRIAQSLMDAIESAKESPMHGICWLEMSKTLAGDKERSSEQQTALVTTGAIGNALKLMEIFVQSEKLQLNGIESLSALVGVVWEALEAFANAAGVRQIENALREHPQSSLIQLRGIRALGSGVGWPTNVQVKSGYSWRSTIEISKTALAQHGSDAELATVALDALEKLCMEHPPSIEDVKGDGGEDLIKNILSTHTAATKLQRSGKTVLDRLAKN